MTISLKKRNISQHKTPNSKKVLDIRMRQNAVVRQEKEKNIMRTVLLHNINTFFEK